MRLFLDLAGAFGCILRSRALSVLVRATVITSMSFAVAFGFLAMMRSEVAGYDAHMFAIGAAALLGAACGAIGLLFDRCRQLRAQLRKAEARAEDLADRNWELKDAEERTRSFLEAPGDVIVRRDSEGRITYVNDVFCALAGRGRDVLVGDDFALPVLEQGTSTALADGTRVHDQKIATRDGPRWLAWREVMVRAGNETTETQSVGRDVTERVDAGRALAEARDQAEAANRAKSRFLAVVSHEIRTPLNGILGMADLLLDTSLTAEQKTYARAVKTSGDALLSLIDEILDFSKIEAGRLDLDARPFDLRALAEETVELIAPRAQAKNLEIASYVDDGLPQRAVGDVARLRQVLLNLASNAIKFTEQGGIAIIIEPGDSPDEIRFMVRDTGIGIARTEQERIFLEFEQADTGAARKFDGTGLGLAISRRIVEHMGGRIGVDSTPGEGSTFHLTVRLARPRDDSGEAPAAPDLAGIEVLIVAPSSVSAPLVARRLEAWGARTRIAPDEKVAAALLPERFWSAVIVDHELGTKICEQVARNSSAVERRLVMVTPAERAELPALKRAGFTGYLVKPVRAASLAARFAEEGVAFDQTNVPADDLIFPATCAPNGLNILVAEDNEINALLARALLVRLGHRSTIAASGNEAVEAWFAARAAGKPFDAVLMDIHMPGSDGIEATRRIRAAEAEAKTARTPIIALTANTLDEDRLACRAAGMDGFLIKPLDRERLAAGLAAAAPLAA
jgi:PAS domain S-box-containing protein